MPPPSMSSREGIPVEVRGVDDSEGDVFVPRRGLWSDWGTLRLKEDMMV